MKLKGNETMKNRMIALFLVLALSLTCTAAFADPSEVHDLADGAKISFSEVVRVETAVTEEGEEYPVWYLPVTGSQLIYKAGAAAMGLLVFAYDSWEECVTDSENRKLYNLIGSGMEGTMPFENPLGDITWSDNVCFRVVVLDGGAWKADSLVFRFETATDGPGAAEE